MGGVAGSRPGLPPSQLCSAWMALWRRAGWWLKPLRLPGRQLPSPTPSWRLCGPPCLSFSHCQVRMRAAPPRERQWGLPVLRLVRGTLLCPSPSAGAQDLEETPCCPQVALSPSQGLLLASLRDWVSWESQRGWGGERRGPQLRPAFGGGGHGRGRGDSQTDGHGQEEWRPVGMMIMP